MSKPLTEDELDILRMAATDGDFGPHERNIIRLLAEFHGLRAEVISLEMQLYNANEELTHPHD